VICIGEIVCGDGAGLVALITIQIGSGTVMEVMHIGVLGISILDMEIGAQVIGTGINGITLGTIVIIMVQELII